MPGGYRFDRGDGSIWIPELSPEERFYLKQCGYQPVSGPETVVRIVRDQGKRLFPCYPLTCKTGIRQEENIVKAAACFERFGIRGKSKPTSCPDQIARAVKMAYDSYQEQK